jgi:hypothetical protein
MQDVWPNSRKLRPKWFKPSEFGFTRLEDKDGKPLVGEAREKAKQARIKEGLNMNEQFVWKLECIRSNLPLPFRINSGWRSVAHNAKVGKSPRSAHTKGRAADISTRGWQPWQRKELVRLAREYGIQGFGIAKTFIHLDDYTTKDGVKRPQVWLYDAKNSPLYLTGMDVPESAW